MEKKTVFSGIKPTGDLTLGSYIGAIKNWTELQEEHNCYYCIVDMHSVTIRNDPATLRRRTLEQFAQYIAAGLDYKKHSLYIQSHVSEHAELSWILGCYTMLGELNRMTQFKDMQKKASDNLNGGIYTYPVLMAADILLFNAHLVPVGEDQKQHVELARNIAIRFNGVYGDTFTVPDPLIPKVGARVRSLVDPEAKMSKSDDDRVGSVFLMDSPDDIRKKFKRAKTDSEARVFYDPGNKPGVSNLMSIYSAATGRTYDEIANEFEGRGYGEFKPAVAEAVIELLRPVREKTGELLADPGELERIYREGAMKAKAVAARTLQAVAEKIGFAAR